MGLDRALLRRLRTHGHQPAVERAVYRYSKLGEHSFLWVAIGVLGYALDPARRPVYKRLLKTLAATETVNFAIKFIVNRPRPEIDPPPLLQTATNLSYPSAHASTSFASAKVLSSVAPSSVLYGAAAAMALSRPYLGVHYPSDIAAGAVLGLAVAELVP